MTDAIVNLLAGWSVVKRRRNGGPYIERRRGNSQQTDIRVTQQQHDFAKDFWEAARNNGLLIKELIVYQKEASKHQNEISKNLTRLSEIIVVNGEHQAAVNEKTFSVLGDIRKDVNNIIDERKRGL
jgi:hypothetical protein